MTSAGLGTMSLGTGPLGTSAPGLAAYNVTGARAVALNAVDVTFSEPPLASDPADTDDALYVAGWSLVAIDPSDAKIRLPQFVEDTPSPNTVRVYFDGRLSSDAVYEIIASGTVEAVSGAALNIDRARFRALIAPDAYSVQTLDGVFDIANPQTAQDLPSNEGTLGDYQAQSDGSLVLDTGVSGVRKRILRRLTSQPGGFLHLGPDYGLNIDIGTKLTPTLLRNLAQSATRQVQQEPEVERAQVEVRRDARTPGIVYLTVRARLLDGTDVDVVAKRDVLNRS